VQRASTTDEQTSVSTLGRRLDVAGRRLADRHHVAPAWTGVLAPVLARTQSHVGWHATRFERRESAPGSAPVPGSVRLPPSTGRTTGAVDLRAGGGLVPLAAETAGEPARAVRRPAPGRSLPSDVRAALRAVSGPGADVLRVHDDAGADLLARSASADAVTAGRDIHLRAGRGRTDEPDGLALLAHEATHVTAALDPAAGARRLRPGGAAVEETAAGAAEGRALRTAERSAPPPERRSSPPDGTPQPAVPTTAPAAAAPAALPHAGAMLAAVDRELPAAPTTPLDVEALRRGLVEDLMRQLRTEFERGA
jgi:hypothetical protein